MMHLHAGIVVLLMMIVLYTAGEIAAVIIGIALIIVGVSIIIILLVTLKLKNDRHQRVKQNLKSELR